MSKRKVYILILNWNGRQDTIECLECVFRTDYPDYQVIVCDNGSQDGSIEGIKEWASGSLGFEVPEESPLRHFQLAPVEKPIACVEYDRAQAESGGGDLDGDARLILIRTGTNLGFAGGNNVGLRYALARHDFEYVWLLNNDTVVRPDSLGKLVERMSEKSDAGMCGGTLLYYHEPGKVQALGGARYNKWLGSARSLGFLQSAGSPVDPSRVERRMDYVSGACMLVSREFLRDVGLMSEEYFLYFEELDWAVRGRSRYTLAYAPDCVVYHKEGRATGGNSYRAGDKSRRSDYFSIRNRLAVTRKFYPYALPTVYLSLLGVAFNRIRRRQWDRLGMIFKPRDAI